MIFFFVIFLTDIDCQIKTLIFCLQNSDIVKVRNILCQISQNLKKKIKKKKIKQSQSLVMTPQLQQAIKLLQLTNLELCDLVNKELEENPFK